MSVSIHELLFHRLLLPPKQALEAHSRAEVGCLDIDLDCMCILPRLVPFFKSLIPATLNDTTRKDGLVEVQ
jgi:hypothetical protein